MTNSIQYIQAIAEDPMQRTWIDPSSVTGFDAATVFKRNKERYCASDGYAEDEYETEDEIIADYLMNCILWSERSGKVVNPATILDAAIFLMVRLGCRQVAHIWPFIREYFDAQNLLSAYQTLKNVYESTGSEFARLLLADFILDFFPNNDPKRFSTDDEMKNFFSKLEEHRKSYLLTN
jgi:hypothetical protein